MNIAKQPKPITSEQAELYPIKKTKSIIMVGNKYEVRIHFSWIDCEVSVPMSKAFSLKRGLETYVQRFYRKK